MPAKTGGSHALAAFVSMVVGTVLSKYIWTYTPPLAEVGAAIGDVLGLVGIPMSREQAGALVVVLGLSFVWGVVYHVTRDSGESDRGSERKRQW
jgi:uncharacterized membrane protein YoaK (UPF0700 family)